MKKEGEAVHASTGSVQAGIQSQIPGAVPITRAEPAPAPQAGKVYNWTPDKGLHQ